MGPAGAAVAATKASKSLTALTTAALALPGMGLQAAVSEAIGIDEVDLQYARYQEGGNRIRVDVYQGLLDISLGSRSSLLSNVTVDAWAGASPVLNLPASSVQVVSGATKIGLVDSNQPITDPRPLQVMSSATPRETRRQLDFAGTRQLGDVAVEVAGGLSNEPDYDSNFYNINTRWDINQKMTTLALGLGYVTSDIHVIRNLGFVTVPADPIVQADKTDWLVLPSITQILGKRSLLQSSLGYTESSGFLSNPYKKVFIQGVGVIFDTRPDRREQVAWSNRYARYFPDWEAALHLDYRFYHDSWGIDSHTFQVAWDQPLARGWQVAPRIRYYTQDAADFYAPYFTAPNPTGFHSSDYRLSGFGALSPGLSLSKKWSDRLQLEAGFEYYTHQAGLKLGGTDQGDFADFSFILVNVVFRLKF